MTSSPDDSQDRASLIEALAKGLPDVDRGEALQQYLVVLREHPDPDVREAAAYGLRDFEMQDRRASAEVVVEALLGVLGDSDEETRVRDAAAESVGFILQ